MVGWEATGVLAAIGAAGTCPVEQALSSAIRISR
jgi:hypothetical protein